MNQDFKSFTPNALGISANIHSASGHGDPSHSGTIAHLQLEQPYPNEVLSSGRNAAPSTEGAMPDSMQIASSAVKIPLMSSTVATGTHFTGAVHYYGDNAAASTTESTSGVRGPISVEHGSAASLLTIDSGANPVPVESGCMHDTTDRRVYYRYTTLLSQEPGAIDADASTPVTAARTYFLNEPSSLRKPSHRDLEHLRLFCPEIFSDRITKNAKSTSDLDLLNLNDYFANWGILDRTTQYLLAEFVNSDWSRTEWQSKGLKTKEGNVTLAESILLLIGLGINNVMPNTGAILVLSNLKTKAGIFRKGGQKQRSIDPKAACFSQQEFLRIYAPEMLFPANKAYIVLFESNDQLKSVGSSCNLDEKRVAIGLFFNAVRNALHISKKHGYITAFLAGHEISTSSISPFRVNPHSHVVIWMPHHQDTTFLDIIARDAGINLKYKPTPITEWSKLKDFIPYIMQAHSLVMRYKAERPDSALRDFNLEAREALYAGHELYHGHGTHYDVIDPEAEGTGSKGRGKKNTIGRVKLIKSGIPKRKVCINKRSSPSARKSRSSASNANKSSKSKRTGAVSK